jgi:dolichol-phosphate mannosyltransferase
LIAWVGYRSVGVPFEVQRRPAGRSKYSVARLVHFGVLGVISFSRRPLQAAIYVGLTVAVCGFLLAVITVAQYFLQGHFPSGWTTLVILISGFSGIHLIFLGVVGEYIGAIFDEVKARPHYLIEEKINLSDDPAT